MRDGIPLPQRIQNAPQMGFGLHFYFAAFLELSSCRQIGYAPGPIPWTAVQEYARTHGLDEEQCEDMHIFVQEMDTVYVSHMSKKASAKK